MRITVPSKNIPITSNLQQNDEIISLDNLKDIQIDTYSFREEKWSFRVCGKCLKTRILDDRASSKYPLGSYQCGDKTYHLQFECNNLVNTTCDIDEDIKPKILSPDITRESTSPCLLVDKTIDPRKPTCGLLINVCEKTTVNLDNKDIREMHTYDRKDKHFMAMPFYNDHVFNILLKMFIYNLVLVTLLTF